MPTAGSGPDTGEPLSEIFGVDPVGLDEAPLIGVTLGGVRIERLIGQGVIEFRPLDAKP